jgi:ribosome-associated protein
MLVLEAAADRKGEDPVALNLKGIATFTDCFVIVGGTQRRQTQAICDAIIERLAEKGQKPGHLEGYDLGDWILIDYADLVVHVFTRDTREFYGLENLWGDAPRMSLARRESRGSRDTPAARKG